jgi:hypothetical protein
MVEEFYDEIGDPPKVGWRSQYRLAPKDPFRPIGKGNAQWLVTTKNPDIKPAVRPPDLVAAQAAWERLKGEDVAAKEWPSAWLDSFRDFIYDIGRSRIEGVDGAGNTPLTLVKVDSKKPHGRGNTLWAPAGFR